MARGCLEVRRGFDVIHGEHEQTEDNSMEIEKERSLNLGLFIAFPHKKKSWNTQMNFNLR